MDAEESRQTDPNPVRGAVDVLCEPGGEGRTLRRSKRSESGVLPFTNRFSRACTSGSTWWRGEGTGREDGYTRVGWGGDKKKQ